MFIFGYPLEVARDPARADFELDSLDYPEAKLMAELGFRLLHPLYHTASSLAEAATQVEFEEHVTMGAMVESVMHLWPEGSSYWIADRMRAYARGMLRVFQRYEERNPRWLRPTHRAVIAGVESAEDVWPDITVAYGTGIKYPDERMQEDLRERFEELCDAPSTDSRVYREAFAYYACRITAETLVNAPRSPHIDEWCDVVGHTYAALATVYQTSILQLMLRDTLLMLFTLTWNKHGAVPIANA
jgi:hypothetical protein